jgi:hypothetical protein
VSLREKEREICLFRVRNEEGRKEMERAEAEECRELGKRQDRKSHVRFKLQINTTIKIHFKNNILFGCD